MSTDDPRVGGTLGACASNIAWQQGNPYAPRFQDQFAPRSVDEWTAQRQMDQKIALARHMTALQGGLRDVDHVNPLRREALQLAIQAHSGLKDTDGQITKTARLFESYLRGDTPDSPDSIAVDHAMRR